MKKIITVLFLILMASFVSAELPICEDIISEPCRMVTPQLDCPLYTFSILNQNGSNILKNAPLAYYNESAYYFDINKTGNLSGGTFQIFLCDGAIRQIYIREDEKKMIATTLSLFGQLFLWTIFYFGALFLSGRSGRTIQFLNILQLFTGIVVSLSLLNSIFILGFTILFVSVGTFVALIIKDN
jgi:hypothetical protein